MHVRLLLLILVIIIVPTSQSEVTDTQSHDNQPRQDDERSRVEINNGSYMCKRVLLELCIHGTMMYYNVCH